MPSDPVCAVIYGNAPGSEEVAAAVADQQLPPATVLHEGALRGAVGAAVATEARWLWLLDGWALPAPDALVALLAAAETVDGRAPLLLSSKVVDATGRLHPDATPRHEMFEKQHSVDAIERHLVQLRTAAPGSVLVQAGATGRFGAPRADLPPGLDMSEWSARLLRSWDDTGYLVPASVAVRRAAPVQDRSFGHWAARARVVGSGGWTMTERLWETFLLGRDAVAVARDRAAQGRAGVGAPGASPSRSPRRMAGMTRHEKRL